MTGPLDALLPALLDAVRAGENAVVTAAPGAGKTTRIPPALLGVIPGEVWVLEPRRLAARMAARFVAGQMGERLGETVGYQVRFEDVSGPKTRLRFLTEGVLTRRMLSDRELRRVSAVVVDEFHERHLDGDLALALLRRLQRSARADLRLVVMSATLDAGPVAHYLGGARVLSAEGRLFPVDVAYTPHSAATPEERIAAAVARLEPLDGDVLVFLPGAAEIRRASRACEGIARRLGLRIAPLHGDLSPEEQDRAVLPSADRKLILSTNVAESSITIEGVTAVIDSGLERVASDSPWTGLPRVEIARISRSSAIQRAGRAGRVRAGRVIRLYTEDDFLRRPVNTAAEILRRELSQTALDLRVLGAEDLEWFDSPPAAQWDAARALLTALGADRDGERMSRLPVQPRLARFLLECPSAEAARIAAALASGERLPREHHASGPSDLLVFLERDLAPRAMQLARRLDRGGRASDEQLRKAALAAFPDRVARRRSGDELLLSNGSSAVLDRSSVVRDAELMVAVEVEERPDQGAPLVRLASAIEPEWLLDRFPERMREESRVEWNRAASRVEAVSALYYDQLAIEESRGAMPDANAAAQLLAEKVMEAGVERFVDREEWEQFTARASFAAEYAGVTPLDVRAAVEAACAGCRSFADVSGGAIVAAARHGRELIDEIAPVRLKLPGGRQARVRYAEGQTPWVSSRLQDFFGMTETPRIARGQVALVVHLLAPNQRPVQMTTDLRGFWERLYPQVRRELMRRYPRHAWPEKPG